MLEKKAILRPERQTSKDIPGGHRFGDPVTSMGGMLEEALPPVRKQRQAREHWRPPDKDPMNLRG